MSVYIYDSKMNDEMLQGMWKKRTFNSEIMCEIR